jgi:hypothetical protein
LLQRLNITIENLDFSNQTKIFFLLEEADFSYVLLVSRGKKEVIT